MPGFFLKVINMTKCVQQTHALVGVFDEVEELLMCLNKDPNKVLSSGSAVVNGRSKNAYSLFFKSSVNVMSKPHG